MMKLLPVLGVLVSVVCEATAQRFLDPASEAEAVKTLPIPAGWHIVALTSPIKSLKDSAPSESRTKLSLAEAFGHLGKTGFVRSDPEDVPQGQPVEDALASQIPPGWRVQGYTPGASTQTNQNIQPDSTQSPAQTNDDHHNVVDSDLASQVPPGWHIQGMTAAAEPQAPVSQISSANVPHEDNAPASQISSANVPHEDNAATKDELANLIPPGWHVQGYTAQQSNSATKDELASLIPPGWHVQGMPEAAPTIIPSAILASDQAQSSQSMVVQNLESNNVVSSENDPTNQIPPGWQIQRVDEGSPPAPLASGVQAVHGVTGSPGEPSSATIDDKHKTVTTALSTAASTRTSDVLPKMSPLSADTQERLADPPQSFEDGDVDISAPHEAAVDSMFGYAPSISAIKGDSEAEVEEQAPVVSKDTLGHITSIDCLTAAIDSGGNPCNPNVDTAAQQRQSPPSLNLSITHAFLGGTKVRSKEPIEQTKAAPVEKSALKLSGRPHIEAHSNKTEEQTKPAPVEKGVPQVSGRPHIEVHSKKAEEQTKAAPVEKSVPKVSGRPHMEVYKNKTEEQTKAAPVEKSVPQVSGRPHSEVQSNKTEEPTKGVQHIWSVDTERHVKKRGEKAPAAPVEENNVLNIWGMKSLFSPAKELRESQQERRHRDHVEHLELETRQQHRRHEDHVIHVIQKGGSQTTQLAGKTSDNYFSHLVDTSVQAIDTVGRQIDGLTHFIRQVGFQPARAHNLADVTKVDS